MANCIYILLCIFSYDGNLTYYSMFTVAFKSNSPFHQVSLATLNMNANSKHAVQHHT